MAPNAHYNGNKLDSVMIMLRLQRPFRLQVVEAGVDVTDDQCVVRLHATAVGYGLLFLAVRALLSSGHTRKSSVQAGDTFGQRKCLVAVEVAL